ncbi:MAG: hypothetical protein JOZ41_01455 [Chloroflexi bacterium]|nr:hypothetical protein [Chloroflexota bacterium]
MQTLEQTGTSVGTCGNLNTVVCTGCTSSSQCPPGTFCASLPGCCAGNGNGCIGGCAAPVTSPVHTAPSGGVNPLPRR